MATTSTLIHRTSLPLLRRHPSTIDGLTPERPFFSSSNTQGTIFSDFESLFSTEI